MPFLSRLKVPAAKQVSVSVGMEPVIWPMTSESPRQGHTGIGGRARTSAQDKCHPAQGSVYPSMLCPAAAPAPELRSAAGKPDHLHAECRFRCLLKVTLGVA